MSAARRLAALFLVAATARFVEDAGFLGRQALEPVLGDLVQDAVDLGLEGRVAASRPASWVPRAPLDDAQAVAPPARNQPLEGIPHVARELEVDEAGYHAPDVCKVCYPVPSARDARQELDRRESGDQVLRLDRQEEPQIDVAVGEQQPEREQHTVH